jgi:hypothetical protein
LGGLLARNIEFYKTNIEHEIKLPSKSLGQGLYKT